MILNAPFIITPRMLPGLQIGDTFISFESIEPCVTRDDRDAAIFYIDAPGIEFRDQSMQSGCGGFRDRLQDIIASYLSFLDNAIEVTSLAERGHFGAVQAIRGDGCGFPIDVVQHLMPHHDEVGSLSIELREAPDLIFEEG